MNKNKKDIEHQARLLKRSGKFDPARTVAPTADEQFRELRQVERSERAFADAGECEECARTRREKSDPEALCREHLAQAIGFG